jgi:hypothetical protein
MQNETVSDAVKLTAAQTRLIAALLQMNPFRACKQAHVARSTYYRWIEEEQFKAALTAAKAQLFEDGKRTILGAFQEAAAMLISRMRKSRREDVQVKASQLLLDFNLRVRQLEEIEVRLRAIEEAMR